MVLYQVQLQRSRRNAHRAFLGYRNDFLYIAIIKFAGEDGVAAMAVNINIFYFLISIYSGIEAGDKDIEAQEDKAVGEHPETVYC